MDKNQILTRIKAVTENLDDNEMLFVFASAPQNYPVYFKQDNNFLYLTGLEIPNAIFVLTKIKNKAASMLFIERGIPAMEVWEGKKMTIRKAAELSGIETVYNLDQFDRIISFKLPFIRKSYINIGFEPINRPLKPQHEFIDRIKKRYPDIIFRDLTNFISKFRTQKDDWEVSQMQQAIDVTGSAIESIYRQAKSGMMEYELEAILQYEITRRGFRHMAFKPIIASGVNATILHYVDNNGRIPEDSLVLLDVGASCNNYCADISRTFPVSGKFSKRQQAVYLEVLQVQEEIIELIKPGVSLTDLNKKTVELITTALKRLKLITSDAEYKKYYMHSVSHHLGLDAHDVGARDSILEPGNVITVEPGIYISEEQIGIRIEDDILVTDKGKRNLSSSIPKQIKDLEKICAR